MVAHKKNENLRIYIDPPELNKNLKREPQPVLTVEGYLPHGQSARVFTKLDVRNGFWHIALDASSSRLLTFANLFGQFQWM